MEQRYSFVAFTEEFIQAVKHPRVSPKERVHGYPWHRHIGEHENLPHTGGGGEGTRTMEGFVQFGSRLLHQHGVETGVFVAKQRLGHGH